MQKDPTEGKRKHFIRITSKEKEKETAAGQFAGIFEESGLRCVSINRETRLDIEVAVDGAEEEQNKRILESVRKIQKAFPKKSVIAFHAEPATTHRVSSGNRCDD